MIFVLLANGCCFAQTQEEDSVLYALNSDNQSMFEIIAKDYFSDKANRKEKRDCYRRYLGLFFKTVYSQLTAPFMYILYYQNRQDITNDIQDYYDEHNLTDMENIGMDIVSGKVDKDSLKAYLGPKKYNLWLYGDTKRPVEDGGVPADYKNNLPLFLRRWLYCAVRNPRWNSTYVNNYSSYIDSIYSAYDTRCGINTHNYGTGDTYLGKCLRWYIDKDGKWWFYYERTKQTEANQGNLFYFGAIGFGEYKDGKVDINAAKPTRFEFSLNRKVTIDF